MKVTDYSDKVQLDYDPLVDIEIDIDAPYIQFDYEEDIPIATLPKSGVYDTLFYDDEKILIVNDVSEVEIRFYSTENPNENYRTGQKHFKGRILDIKQISDDEKKTEYNGFSISVDMSKQYNAKTQVITIDKTYVDITKTRCIAILYFNETGRVIHELVMPINDWFSSKVYLNTAYVMEEAEKLAYKVGDIVDIEYYKKIYDSQNTYTIELFTDTGRIVDLKLTKKRLQYNDENGNVVEEDLYYYIITFDCSSEFNKKVINIAHNVIKSMKIHVIIPEI